MQDVDELVWALDALVETGCRRGFPAGIVTISTSGGVAVCATDALDAVGAPVAPLEDSTIERLAGLGGGQTIFNPFDMGAYGIGEPGGRYEEMLQALGDDRTVGVVLELSGTGSNVVDPRVNSDGNEANGFLSEPTVLGSIISGCGKVAILSTPASLGHGRSSWRDGLLRIAGARRTAVVANALTRWSSSLKPHRGSAVVDNRTGLRPRSSGADRGCSKPDRPDSYRRAGQARAERDPRVVAA